MSGTLSGYPLNPEQFRAVCAPDRSILILAGAGSGKTRVLVARIVWFLKNTDLKPSEILALTFTNKAAQEMRERLQKISTSSQEIFISTFHSFGSFFLKEYSHIIGISRYFSIYDNRKSTQLLEKQFPDCSAIQCQHWYDRIQSFKDGSLSEIDQQEIQNIIDTYNATLKKNNAVDFGDLIYLTYKHLQNNKELRNQVQQRWKAILVDEYQDTNRSQEKLLMSLRNSHSYITVIGDDDQTIYRFRGSDPSNIRNFSKYFPDTKLFILEQNYRSNLAILSCANRLISQNSNRVSKNLFSHIQGNKPQVLQFHTQDAECQYLCALLQKERSKKTAILYRNNSQRHPLEKAFRKQNIPYIILGSLSFYDQEEIKTLCAWASFLVNPYDQTSFTRLCGTPPQGFGKKSLDIILMHWQSEENITILEALYACKGNLIGKAKKNAEKFYEQFQHWSQLLEKLSLKNFFEIYLRETGLYEFYLTSDQKNDTYRLKNLLGFVSSLERENLQGYQGLCTFLEDVSLMKDKKNNSETLQHVTLTTIHQAKGLEFERVIIIGMDEGIFPNPTPNYNKTIDFPAITISLDELEDERRLCYVAVTRAKSELLMTCCLRRWWFNGRITTHSPSRFLSEIGNELFETIRFDETPQYNSSPYRQRPRKSFSFSYQNITPKRIIKVPQYTVGDSVLHAEHGYGEVIKTEHISGHCVTIVRFQDKSVKKFLDEFTKIKMKKESKQKP